MTTVAETVAKTINIQSSKALPSVIGSYVASVLIIAGESVIITPDDAKPGVMACIVYTTADSFMLNEYIRHAVEDYKSKHSKDKEK